MEKQPKFGQLQEQSDWPVHEVLKCVGPNTIKATLSVSHSNEYNLSFGHFHFSTFLKFSFNENREYHPSCLLFKCFYDN